MRQWWVHTHPRSSLMCLLIPPRLEIAWELAGLGAPHCWDVSHAHNLYESNSHTASD